MSAYDLIVKARNQGVFLSLSEGKLSYRSVGKTLTKELKEEITEHRDEIILFLKSMKGQQQHFPEPVPCPERVPIPLSFAQERLWMLDQFYPGSAQYNVTILLPVPEMLDQKFLHRALLAMVERHKILRTVYATDANGNGVQVVNETPEFDFASYDLRSIDGASDPKNESQKNELDRIAREKSSLPFNLKQGPLLRAALVILNEHLSTLIIVVHHIAFDGLSAGVFVQELQTFYLAYKQGQSDPLAPCKLQYSDYAFWQRQLWRNGNFAENLQFWKTKLKGIPARHELPLDRSRPAKPTLQGAAIRETIDVAVVNRLANFARQSNVTMFMVINAAFAVLLFRYSRSPDIVVGTPVSNRHHSHLAPLIGYFANTLVLRTDVSGNPKFNILVEQSRDWILELYARQDVPFEKLVDELQPEREPNVTPVFQIMLSYKSRDMAVAARGGENNWRGEEYKNGTVKFDLLLDVEEQGESFCFEWEYAVDLFEKKTISAMAKRFNVLLRSISLDPYQNIEQYRLMSDVEERDLTRLWKGPRESFADDVCIHEFIELHAKQVPGIPAVVYNDQILSYRELNNRANVLARFLLEMGVGLGSRVGLCLNRSPEIIVGILAVLKCGAAYVPLDPGYPSARLDYICRDAQLEVVVTTTCLTGCFDVPKTFIFLDSDNIQTKFAAAGEDQPDNIRQSVGSGQLAYVIYTSGTTGNPKGVAVEHGSVANLCHAMKTLIFDPTNATNWGWNASYSFDASIQAVTALMCGLRVTLIPEDLRLDPVALAALFKKRSVDITDTTPTQLKVCLGSNFAECFEAPLTWVIGGEEISKSLWNDITRMVQHASFRAFNVYGPTECTVNSSIVEIIPGSTPSIGKPIPNVTFYVLDKHGGLVPPGLSGELFIAGKGLARGYFGQPGLTAEKFILHRFPNSVEERIYATGDLVRGTLDGSIEFLSRLDNQIKIRGFRVELGEIESALLEQDCINAVAVVLKIDKETDDQSLIAYVVFASRDNATRMDFDDVREKLGSRLPAYMIPSHFVAVEFLPMTKNGKLDKSALQELELNNQPKRNVNPPVTRQEKILVEVWSEVLDITPENISVTDNFFSLGGHSLLVLEASQKARVRGLVIEPRDFYSQANIQTLARIKRCLNAQEDTVSAQVDYMGLLSAQINRLAYWRNTPNWFHMVQAKVYSEVFNMGILNRACAYVVSYHDSLRMRFNNTDQGWITYKSLNSNDTEYCELISCHTESPNQLDISKLIEDSAKRCSLSDGPMLKVLVLPLACDQQSALIFMMHHLVVDEYSLAIVVEDIMKAYESLAADEEINLPPKTASINEVAYFWKSQANVSSVSNEVSYWTGLPWSDVADIPEDLVSESNLMRDMRYLNACINQENIRVLLGYLAANGISAEECLVAATVNALAKWKEFNYLTLAVMDSGRSPHIYGNGPNISRTVGYLNQKRILFLRPEIRDSGLQGIIGISAQLRAIPGQGRNLRQLKTLSDDPLVRDRLREISDMPPIWFNFLGNVKSRQRSDHEKKFYDLLEMADSGGVVRESCDMSNPRHRVFNFICMLNDGDLRLFLEYNPKLHRQETIRNICDLFVSELVSAIQEVHSVNAEYSLDSIGVS